MAKAPSLKVRHKKAPNFDIKGLTDGEPVVPRPWEKKSKKKNARRLSKKAKARLHQQSQVLAGHASHSSHRQKPKKTDKHQTNRPRKVFFTPLKREEPALPEPKQPSVVEPVVEEELPPFDLPETKQNKAPEVVADDAPVNETVIEKKSGKKADEPAASLEPIVEVTEVAPSLKPEGDEDAPLPSQEETEAGERLPIPEAVKTEAEKVCVDLAQLPDVEPVERYMDVDSLFEDCALRDRYKVIGMTEMAPGDPLGLVADLRVDVAQAEAKAAAEAKEPAKHDEGDFETALLNDHDPFVASKQEAVQALGFFQQLHHENRQQYIEALAKRLPEEVRQKGVIWAEALANELYVENGIDRKAVIEKALANFPSTDANAIDVARRWLLGNFAALNDLNALFPTHDRLDWLEFPHHRTALLDPLEDYVARMEAFRRQKEKEGISVRISSLKAKDLMTDEPFMDAPEGREVPVVSAAVDAPPETPPLTTTDKVESQKALPPKESPPERKEKPTSEPIEHLIALGRVGVEKVAQCLRTPTATKKKALKTHWRRLRIWTRKTVKPFMKTVTETAMKEKTLDRPNFTPLIEKFKNRFIGGDRITIGIWVLCALVCLAWLIHSFTKPLPLYYVDFREIEQIAIQAQVVAKAFPEEKDLQCPEIDQARIQAVVNGISERYQIPIFDATEVARVKANEQVKVKNITKAVLTKLGLPPQKVSLANDRFSELVNNH